MKSDSFGLLPYTQEQYENGDYKGSDDYLGDLEEHLQEPPC